jgi:hypothetical protein
VRPRPLPTVCAWCERVRTSAGRWEKRETAPAAAEATHGICPECLVEVQHTSSPDAPGRARLIRAGARPLP